MRNKIKLMTFQREKMAKSKNEENTFVLFFLSTYRLSSLNFPPLFTAKFAGKKSGKLSGERRYKIAKNQLRDVQ